MLHVIDNICDVAHKYSILGIIFGDMLQPKVKTKTNPRHVSSWMRECAWMMTYLRKSGIVDDNYTLLPSYRTVLDPMYIFRVHML